MISFACARLDVSFISACAQKALNRYVSYVSLSHLHVVRGLADVQRGIDRVLNGKHELATFFQPALRGLLHVASVVADAQHQLVVVEQEAVEVEELEEMVGEVASLRSLAASERRGKKRPNAPLLAAQTQKRDHEGADAAVVGVVEVALAEHVLEDHHHRTEMRVASELADHVAGGQEGGVLVEAEIHVDSGELGLDGRERGYAVLEFDDRNTRMTDDDDVGGKRALAEHLWSHFL